MNEPVLKALVQLFALISDVHDKSVLTGKERDIVRMFLERHLNSELTAKYMSLFDEYLTVQNAESYDRGSLRERKHTALTAMRILGICEKINEELQQKQKIYVIIQLIDFILFGAEITENELDFLETVSNAFNIPQAEYIDIKTFILHSYNEVPGKNRVIVINGSTESNENEFKHIYRPKLRVTIALLHIQSTNTYILRYSGNEDLLLNGQNIIQQQTYIFDYGSAIRISGVDTIYYNDINSVFSEEAFQKRVFLEANNISLRFKNSDSGIQKLGFYGESGTLVGIMGGSGVGKSTLLNVLSGITRPESGEVLINGYNLYSENDRSHLKGVIGFVPQDDLLIEDLTVFQNLYYNARMCLNNLSSEELDKIVQKTLIELDLEDVKDLKVGNPLNKVISGGQRKRLNIALEIIREPTILFVDEPTSGLSSVDSEIVINLLKDLTHRGKLVIINIHQPGSEIYKMFDKILIIDKGGYNVFYGNPSEAIVYFKTNASYANPEEDRCITCGNVNPDQLLQIIEAKVVNENGKPTRIRKVSPKEWAEKFGKETDKEKRDISGTRKEPLPGNLYSVPGLLKQSEIFFVRNVMSKISNRQYIIITLLGSPLLAFLLAYFTRYSSGSSYIFSNNSNLPAFLFMSVITAIFLGLMVSSEEIVKDRKILKRESFLDLSWFSYINSKLFLLFIISAVQTLSFVLIGNLILGIKGMTLSYWLVLFTTASCANIIGLNISSAFNSIITIYIIIPFIIIPQLLFSGVMVRYDKLHLTRYSSKEYVPIIGDLMPARWSFEALAVNQFKSNRYEKNFINYEIQSNTFYYASHYLVDVLENKLNENRRYNNSDGNSSQIKDNFRMTGYYIDQLSNLSGISPGNWIRSLNIEGFNDEAYREAYKYLELIKKKLRLAGLKIDSIKDSITESIANKIGPEDFVKLKDDNQNARLNALVLDEENLTENTVVTKDKIIQKFRPGYTIATSKWGRAHFYAPVKLIGSKEIDTYWFNLIVLWTVFIALYICLYYKLFQKMLDSIADIRFSRTSDNRD
jgi:ABC transport system ATP-binding/permease protein